MRFRIRAINIEVKTQAGLFAFRSTFERGLVIVRADNTSGKSTVVQAVIYALGLEHMLSASSVAPLHYALTTSLKHGGKEHRVVESDVYLEIENGSTDIVTVRRSIVSGRRQSRLITVTFGPSLTAPAKHEGKDFFVRMDGAAQREFGFHRWFAEWLGWSLPEVARFDGSECPLYLEALFPLFIVEQKHGWTGIQTRFPTHFRIREIGQRVIEFVVKMDIENTFAQRTAIRQQISAAEDRWKTSVASARQALRTEGAVIQGVPGTPQQSWQKGAESLPLIFDENRWKQISEALSEAEEALSKLSIEKIRPVNEKTSELESVLASKTASLSELDLILGSMMRDLDLEEAQQKQIAERLVKLRIDRKHFQDLLRLQNLGSSFAPELVAHQCPTCSQPISDTLLSQVEAQQPMTLADNIAFLEGQLSTFENIYNDGERVIEAKRSKVAAIQAVIRDTRAEIRAAKEALSSTGDALSTYDVRQRLIAEDRVNKLTNAQQVMIALNEQLGNVIEVWKRLHEELAALPEGLSKLDESKLAHLQNLYREQLSAYGFKSVDPNQIVISRDTYRPILDGFDLGFNLSASDSIRSIWSYVFSLLELARIFSTNHLGFLLLDEPRQQQTNKASFAEFAKRASNSLKENEQIIIFTSEEKDVLEALLKGIPQQYLNFDAMLLVPVTPTV